MVDILQKTTQKDTATLVAETALLVDTTLADFDAAMLLLSCKVEMLADWANVTTDHVLFGLAYGDATIAQIAAAFTTAIANPENAQAYRENQTATRAVVDFVALDPPDTAGNVKGQSIEFRIPKGGLPANKGSGFQTFVFNPSNTAAYTNGPLLLPTTKWIFARL